MGWDKVGSTKRGERLKEPISIRSRHCDDDGQLAHDRMEARYEVQNTTVPLTSGAPSTLDAGARQLFAGLRMYVDSHA